MHTHTNLIVINCGIMHLYPSCYLFTYTHGMARSNNFPKTVAGNYKHTHTHTGRVSLIYNSMNQSLHVPGKMTNSKVCFND